MESREGGCSYLRQQGPGWKNVGEWGDAEEEGARGRVVMPSA